MVTHAIRIFLKRVTNCAFVPIILRKIETVNDRSTRDGPCNATIFGGKSKFIRVVSWLNIACVASGFQDAHVIGNVLEKVRIL